MKNYRYFIATLMLAIAGAFQASAQVTETPYSRLGYGTLGDNATPTSQIKVSESVAAYDAGFFEFTALPPCMA